MRSLIFFGSDQYSAIVLRELLHSEEIKLLGVVTDQQSGGSPVDNLAKQHNLKITYYPALPDSIKAGTLGLCASFDHLLSASIINLFHGHLYNLHPSLLPQYRNVSPVQYAIALGNQVTGITLFHISPGIDNGQILAQVEEPILSDDTTPTLTARLFTKGTQLFIDFFSDTPTNRPTDQPIGRLAEPLIFTQRLTRDSGYVEWSALHKLIQNQTIAPSETKNVLLSLRLTRSPKDPQSTLHDLLRALTPWPGIWSLVNTKKGEVRLSVESVLPHVTVKISGKPKPITWTDFTIYYLK